MNLPSRSGSPIRSRLLLEVELELQRLRRLVRQPRHEVLHRRELHDQCDYHRVMCEEPGFPTEIVETLRRLPRGFLSVYSLHRETAAWLYRTVAAERPGRIVETGCGISTVLTALALEAAGAPADPAAFVSLEAEETWLRATADVLATLGLTGRVSLRLAPLVEVSWRGRTWRSYDPAASADLSGVDQLLVDGPPKTEGRAPVLGLLHPHLRPGCRVILDDARRPGERAALDMWEALGLARVVGHLPIGNGITILESL